MKFDVAAVRQCLKSFDFKTLFREHLGWDNHHATLDVSVEGNVYRLTAVAQKRGFVAFLCPTIPDRATRLKIDQRVTKSVREHFVIYTDEKAGEQVWHWVRREPGKPLASRDHRFHIKQTGDPLIQRLNQIAVSLEEEEQITVVDIAGRARAAFDVDRVTKRFYDRFKAEHAAFQKLIEGIPSDDDRRWYTSLMLNRLMFVYFIQKKGFLDGDTDYLRHRLAMVQKIRGKNKFHSFYRYFLLRLFHEGLGKPPEERKLDPEFEKLLGKVPFLNGSFFEVHELEERWREIDIPDHAFEKLFDFFDQYAWHLDERPLRADNEINPDVVGYIFEKYVNQKQMGAYYTKEDITEYISKNTVIPFLFEAAKEKCAIAFQPHSALWRLLRDDPDRYIYPAVRHGVIRDDGSIVPESELPDFVQKGMHDPKARMFDKRYNLEQAPAGDPIRLVTETWREYVYRRNRCLEIREKLQRGEVHEINDLITLNLDIWQFARDAIINCEGPELLRAFWNAIQHVSVLDPTCGSGAFLFAALRILETLYSDCLERMERFVEDLEGKKHHPEQFSDFKKVLQQIAKHPNERYFILKSIIINNLFGVDIMEEAVEICKLRLFLKLVAQVETIDQIEPLPDIDFNIRAGNTLVGFATLDDVRKAMQGRFDFDKAVKRIEEEAELVERAFNQFRAQQTTHGGRVTVQDKQELRERLRKLTDQLDRFLAAEYGVNVGKPKEFEAWKASHQPFHWFAEFYGIMHAGGFHVIIGNPPYVSSAKVRKNYTVKQYLTERCPDIYAWCVERVSQLVQLGGYAGMIIPLSLTFGSDFAPLRKLLYSAYRTNWFSSYGRIPAALFAHDVRVRNTIHLGAKRGDGHQYTTRLHRWFESERDHLLSLLSYVRFDPECWSGRIPKLNTQTLVDAFERASRRGGRLEFAISPSPTKHKLYFKKTAYNWLTFCRSLPPCYDERGRAIPHTKFGEVYFREADLAAVALCLLNGKIMLAFWFAIGDDFHVTKWMFADLPIDLTQLPNAEKAQLVRYADRLEQAMREATSFKVNAGRLVGNYNLARCRYITDESDLIFSKVFGFEEAWADIELLYVQCVRTNFESEEDCGQ
ncbi:DNA methyltransferase [Thermogutta sp.]|uniref:Eco57I restriction-modification methylase domain-containing protein n=1 Tax=Thermogutta sp. TaxID=1962930 RepID=UPI00321FB526